MPCSNDPATTALAPPARRWLAPLLLAMLAALPVQAFALGDPQRVTLTAAPGSFALAHNGAAAKIQVDPNDWPGVVRAAHDLQADLQRVTGIEAAFSNAAKPKGDVVLIGTIGRSAILDRLIRAHKIDVSEIRGKWEATLTQVVDHPLPGIARALVIAGSDKRGTIFGVYGLSEQIGVSPWYWWADVPVTHKDALYVSPGRWIDPEPAVKYRGIFLNDEAPALTGWVNEKYGGYNHQFYTKVFELLLRLRANFLWPAMWNSSFAADDPLNAKLADEYGIVMSTSHEEPMMCAEKEWKPATDGPWNYTTNQQRIDRHWRACMERDKNYEQVVTLGMRGVNDTPMSDSANTDLLEKIVANQRQILKETVNPDLTKVPQVWALYKEVQGYYEKGMRVPNDVTLLWSDDNWGNLRRVPTEEERKRPGGAGIYYHFDYVGGPRSYKWLNTNYLPKIQEQMNLALQYGATRIWVVNVGDLKPMEFPIEFFLSMARRPERWEKDHLDEFTRLWAAREFGPEHTAEIANLMTRYTQWNARRKPEQLEPDTFSLTHFDEADRVSGGWGLLTSIAEHLSGELPEDRRAAFFELVLYPMKASAIVNELYVAAGKNHLYATQGRASANDEAAQARRLFAEDAELTDEYNHKLLNGKWNHMMDQTHIGYTFWNEPPLNAMPAVSEVQPLSGSHMAIAVEGSPMTAAGPFPQLTLPAFDKFSQQIRWIDIFNRGSQPFAITVMASPAWIRPGWTSATVTTDTRLNVSLDWALVPPGKSEGAISIYQNEGPAVTVRLLAENPEQPTRDGVRGFVEQNHLVSINAEHFTQQTSAGPAPSQNAHWEKLPNFGETLSAMTVFPVTAPSLEPPQPAPTLEYKMYLFDSGKCEVQAILAPTNNFVPGRGLRYALSFDDQPPIVVDALADNSQKVWEQAVSDGVRKVTTTLTVDQPGYHTLKFRMVDPGVVLEKLVIGFPDPSAPRFPGAPAANRSFIPDSYLGPPESYHVFP